MENILNELEAEKMITLLTFEVKKDFRAENKEIKTAKQLNFYLKSNDERGVDIQARFADFLNGHPLNETIEALNNGEAFLPEKNKEIVEGLVEKAKQFAEKDQKKPQFKKSKNAENNGVVLDRIHNYYKQKLEESRDGKFKGHWKKPWTADRYTSLPRNLSGRFYNMENAAILLQEQEMQDLPVSVFMNKSELKSFDIEADSLIPVAFIIKKGRFYEKDENGKSIKIFSNEYDNLSKAEQDEFRTIYFNKSEPLYHPEQIKAISKPIYETIRSKIKEYEIFDKYKKDPVFAKQEYDKSMRNALTDLFSYIKDQGIGLEKAGDVCAFSPVRDVIKMVEDSKFDSALEYIGTLSHEVSHSTGVEKRNNRKLMRQGNGNGGNNSFGSHNYAFEEIVAEMGSRYFMAKHNLPAALDEQSATYIVNWFSKLEGTENKKINLYNSASKQATEAERFVSKCAERYKNSPDFDLKEIERLQSKIMSNSLTVGDNEKAYDAEHVLNLGDGVDMSQSYDKLQKISHRQEQIKELRQNLELPPSKKVKSVGEKIDESTLTAKEKLKRASEMLKSIEVKRDNSLKNN